MNDLEIQIEELARKAKLASRELMAAPTKVKNSMLEHLCKLLESNIAEIEAANAKDLLHSEANGLSKTMLNRLAFSSSHIKMMVEGVRQVIMLPDPVGKVTKKWKLPNGMKMSRVRVPIGVIGIIYEARPSVTVDAAVLCLKSGNAVVLRGGSEAFKTNVCLANLIGEAARKSGLPAEVVSFVPTTQREAITILCKQRESIDLMIPRGGYGLIKAVVENARMPVIKHFQGICHIYVHSKAKLEMAKRIIVNAKCQRPGVCNAVETVLLDEKIAGKFGPKILKALRERDVKILADKKTNDLIHEKLEEPKSWSEEYLDLILAVKTVKGLDEAIEHIETYGSHHSDAIVTEDKKAAEVFLTRVDSAAVYWNASTRFTDGYEFGMGAEIGISTDKIHARGPMALEDLTSHKYIARGNGQIRK